MRFRGYAGPVTVPVFLVDADALTTDHILLGGPEGRHAATVRRLRPGERIDVGDGAGTVAGCVVTTVGRDTVGLDVVDRRMVAPPSPRIVVVQALIKGDRSELAVETMTEVGVDAIVPWQASRCVVRWRGERRAKGLARWRAAARAATKQARRAHLPEIAEPADTTEVSRLLAAADRAVVLHEAADVALSALPVPATGTAVAVVGPEGGIDDEELAAFRAAGAAAVRLGDTVLRASTAGAVAVAALALRAGRW